MTDSAVRARGLTRRFGELLAVDRLDLDIPRGQIFGFLGPNGSGKTTTLRMLCGLLTPSAGEARVLGLEIPRQAEALRKQLGYLTQQFSLYTDLSTRENMQFMARIYGLDRARARRRIDEVMDYYQLASLARRRLDSMSGGQRQRVALAVATLHQPPLLFLDEPTAAVDPENRREFWEKLFDLGEAGTTILVSTHYMDEAERCHRLAILDRGRLCRDDSPAALLKALQDRVLEVTGDNLRRLREHLVSLPGVLSAAQRGDRLRILLARERRDSEDRIREYCQQRGLTLERARPGLEDAFVDATRQETRQ